MSTPSTGRGRRVAAAALMATVLAAAPLAASPAVAAPAAPHSVSVGEARQIYVEPCLHLGRSYWYLPQPGPLLVAMWCMARYSLP